ncbi:DsbA family oxidoreductase [Rhodococcus kronopolitis]|uniref:DsbA family protein n=1 Tax=Rhodococcus kronopolitis TaxID=1460226 RepID=A0ABV9FSE5_9NOCA
MSPENSDQQSVPAAESAIPPVVIEVWSDIACPWCYIGKRRFAAALETFDHRDRVRVVWRSYQLSPDTPVGARASELEALAKHKGLPPERVREMFAHVSATAAEDGLVMDFDTVIAANTFDAHRLVHLAGDRTDEVLEALFRAHFTDGRVVDDRDELLAIAAEAGLDAAEIRAALESDAAADRVRADIEEARALGISGVPFFVANRAIGVSGAQPVEVFTQLLEQAFEQSGAIVTPDGDGGACADDTCAV